MHLRFRWTPSRWHWTPSRRRSSERPVWREFGTGVMGCVCVGGMCPVICLWLVWGALPLSYKKKHCSFQRSVFNSRDLLIEKKTETLRLVFRETEQAFRAIIYTIVIEARPKTIHLLVDHAWRRTGEGYFFSFFWFSGKHKQQNNANVMRCEWSESNAKCDAGKTRRRGGEEVLDRGKKGGNDALSRSLSVAHIHHQPNHTNN